MGEALQFVRVFTRMPLGMLAPHSTKFFERSLGNVRLTPRESRRDDEIGSRQARPRRKNKTIKKAKTNEDTQQIHIHGGGNCRRTAVSKPTTAVRGRWPTRQRRYWGRPQPTTHHQL